MSLEALIKFGLEESSEPIIKNPLLRNAMADGGTPQLVQPSVDGSRPGYGGPGSGAKPGAGEITWANLNESQLENVKTWGKNKGWDLAETKKNYASSNKGIKSRVRTGITTGSKKKSVFEILDKEQENWFRKNIFNNPEEKYHKVKWKDITGSQKWKLIDRQKKFVSQKAITDDLAKKGYVLASEWFEKQNIPMHKFHTIRREYNTTGGSKKRWDIVKDGGELKVFKKQIGDTNYWYLKSPNKERTAGIVKLFNNPDPYIFDSTAKNIERLLEPGSKYRTILLSGDYPAVNNLPKGLKPNEAATAVYRIAQLLNGHKFDNFDPKIKIDTAASKRIFEKLDKEPWGKAYSSVPRKLNMQLIQNELGTGYFNNTYEGFVTKSKNVLKKAGINLSGMDINELTGLTSGANNKTFTSTQFVNLLPKEYNRIHHASMLREYGIYERALQTALKNGTVNFKGETLSSRQLVNNWEKWRGDWFKRLPKEYKTKSISSTLPSFKLGENTAQTVLGNKRIKQLLNLGLGDITKDTGYFKTFGDIETMRKMPVLKEVASGDPKAVERIKKQLISLCPKGKASGGRIGYQTAGSVGGTLECGLNVIKNNNIKTEAQAKTMLKIAEAGSKSRALRGMLGVWGLGGEAIIEAGIGAYKVLGQGVPADIAWSESYWSYLDPRKYTGELSDLRRKDLEKGNPRIAKYFDALGVLEDRDYHKKWVDQMNPADPTHGRHVDKLNQYDEIIHNFYGGPSGITKMMEKVQPEVDEAEAIQAGRWAGEKEEKYGWLWSDRQKEIQADRKQKQAMKELMESKGIKTMPYKKDGKPVYEIDKELIDTDLKMFGDVMGYGWTPYGLGFGMQQRKPGIGDMKYNEDLGYRQLIEYMTDAEARDRIAEAGGVANMAGGGIAGIRRPEAIPPESGPQPQGLENLKYYVTNT